MPLPQCGNLHQSTTMRTLTIKDDVYNTVTYVLLDCTPALMLDFWEKLPCVQSPNAEDIKDLANDNFSAMTIDLGRVRVAEGDLRDGYMLAITDKHGEFPNAAQNNALVHECFHVTEEVMVGVGMPHSKKTSEAWAYYLAWLHQSILSAYTDSCFKGN